MLTLSQATAQSQYAWGNEVKTTRIAHVLQFQYVVRIGNWNWTFRTYTACIVTKTHGNPFTIF